MWPGAARRWRSRKVVADRATGDQQRLAVELLALEIADGALTGTAAKPIVGAATKRATLIETRAALGLAEAATLAVGDGANDLAMIEIAGLGVAYRAKPIVAAAAAARIEHGDLTALLWAQGVPKADWAA